MCEKYGYDYEPGESKILEEMRATFINKMYHYFGSPDYYIPKMDKNQKRLRKENLNLRL